MSAKTPSKSGREKRLERHAERDSAREQAEIFALRDNQVRRRRGLNLLLGGGGESGVGGGPQPASNKLGVGI